MITTKYEPIRIPSNPKVGDPVTVEDWPEVDPATRQPTGRRIKLQCVVTQVTHEERTT